MRFRNLRFGGLVLSGLLVMAAGASEKQAPEGSAAEGEGQDVNEASSRDQKEFQDKTSKLNTLAVKISEAEKQFVETVHAKEQEKRPEEQQRYIKRLVEIANERNKTAEEYMKIKSELSLRYPNRGEHLNRRYETQSKKSVEELEGAAGLDELLTRTAKMVKKKFISFEERKEERQSPVGEKTSAHEDKPKRLRLEK